MWNDAKEELKRLEAELLAEEEVPEEESEEIEEAEEAEDDALLDEQALDLLLEEDDTRAAESGVYRNFSNGYGKDLRNFASGYEAYNSDKTDTDLDSLSEEVLNPKSEKINDLLIVAGALTLGIVAMAIYYVLRFGGVLG